MALITQDAHAHNRIAEKEKEKGRGSGQGEFSVSTFERKGDMVPGKRVKDRRREMDRTPGLSR